MPLIVLVFLSIQPVGLSAQGTEISVEVGGSSVQPPSGVEGDAAQFLVAGVRAMRFGPGGSGVHASLLAGRALQEGSGGDFFSAVLEGTYWKQVGTRWEVGAEVRGFGFEVVEPFPYRSLGAEGGPVLRYSTRRFTATVSGLAGSGWSRTVLRRYTDGPSQTVEDDLWRYGVTSELLFGSGRVMAGVAGGVHESVGGTYSSVGFRVLGGGRRGAVELRVDTWRTPLGNETTGGVAFILPVGDWSLRGFLGRSEPDPLTLAEPGGGAGGADSPEPRSHSAGRAPAARSPVLHLGQRPGEGQGGSPARVRAGGAHG